MAPRKRPPALTIEGRENELINHAIKLAEKQLIAGTASAQVITHYLKLGSTLAELEKEKLVKENALLTAKAEALISSKTTEALYKSAIEAMRSYSGISNADTD